MKIQSKSKISWWN